jgi:hypothetical protein
MLNQAQTWCDEKEDSGFEVSLEKMHKPIFVSFIDLMYFITAAFFTST